MRDEEYYRNSTTIKELAQKRAQKMDQSKGSLLFTVPNFLTWAQQSTPGTKWHSPAIRVRGLDWQCVLVHDGIKLALFLQCTHPEGDSAGEWICTARARLTIKRQALQVVSNDLEEWREIDGAAFDLYGQTFLRGSADWGKRIADFYSNQILITSAEEKRGMALSESRCVSRPVKFATSGRDRGRRVRTTHLQLNFHSTRFSINFTLSGDELFSLVSERKSLIWLIRGTS